MLVLFGVARRRPDFGGASSEPATDWLKPAAASGSVGFLGCNPVHGWRCVLAGIDPSDGEPFIAKLGLGHSAENIRREAGILASIQGRFAGVVGSVSLDEAGTVQDGAGDWALLRLTHLGNEGLEAVASPEVIGLLSKWMLNEFSEVGGHAWASSLVDRVSENAAPTDWHQSIRRMSVRKALVHGDFAVWNLRRTSEGPVAIDWEWAVEDGVAGIDLAHALRQEAVMIRGFDAKRALDWILNSARRGEMKAYLDSAGWRDGLEDWLRLGLLHSHFHTLNDSSELLGELGINVSSYE
ncbi:hypothetical protein [Haloferula sp.]|uniref:hypothetical protein n=1 Tax=Haloferula sp. TaxID=2497595 RepID=UPI0032A04C58